MTDEDIIDKFLIFTNPITYIGLLFIGVFWLLKTIYKNCQFHNLWFYHFKLKNLNESELNKIDNWCNRKKETKMNKWAYYVVNLNHARTTELLNKLKK